MCYFFSAIRKNTTVEQQVREPGAVNAVRPTGISPRRGRRPTTQEALARVLQAHAGLLRELEKH